MINLPMYRLTPFLSPTLYFWLEMMSPYKYHGYNVGSPNIISCFITLSTYGYLPTKKAWLVIIVINQLNAIDRGPHFVQYLCIYSIYIYIHMGIYSFTTYIWVYIKLRCRLKYVYNYIS